MAIRKLSSESIRIPIFEGSNDNSEGTDEQTVELWDIKTVPSEFGNSTKQFMIFVF